MVEEIAVDTNVLIRLITADDPEQLERVNLLFTNKSVWISNTVLVETEWVLRRGMNYSKSEVAVAFETLSALENVTFEDFETFTAAISGMQHGMDFADAMHTFISNANNLCLHTFDKKLVKVANLLNASTELL